MKKYIYLIIITLMSTISYSQILVELKFNLDFKEKKIDDKFIVYFIEDGNSYYPRIDSNTFIIPNFYVNKKLHFYFKYKRYELGFFIKIFDGHIKEQIWTINYDRFPISSRNDNFSVFKEEKIKVKCYYELVRGISVIARVRYWWYPFVKKSYYSKLHLSHLQKKDT